MEQTPNTPKKLKISKSAAAALYACHVDDMTCDAIIDVARKKQRAAVERKRLAYERIVADINAAIPFPEYLPQGSQFHYYATDRQRELSNDEVKHVGLDRVFRTATLNGNGVGNPFWIALKYIHCCGEMPLEICGVIARLGELRDRPEQVITLRKALRQLHTLEKSTKEGPTWGELMRTTERCWALLDAKHFADIPPGVNFNSLRVDLHKRRFKLVQVAGVFGATAGLTFDLASGELAINLLPTDAATDPDVDMQVCNRIEALLADAGCKTDMTTIQTHLHSHAAPVR